MLSCIFGRDPSRAWGSRGNAFERIAFTSVSFDYCNPGTHKRRQRMKNILPYYIYASSNIVVLLYRYMFPYKWINSTQSQLSDSKTPGLLLLRRPLCPLSLGFQFPLTEKDDIIIYELHFFGVAKTQQENIETTLNELMGLAKRRKKSFSLRVSRKMPSAFVRQLALALFFFLIIRRRNFSKDLRIHPFLMKLELVFIR